MSPTGTATPQSASGFIVTRGRLAFAGGVFATLVSYASLVPLEAHALSAQQAWALIVASWPPAITSKTDFLANLILQFPLGFLLAGAMSHDRRARYGQAILLATVVAALLAFSIEFGQGMFSARTPSTIDVLAEAIGALAGALVWTRFGEALSDFADCRWRELGSPALLLLGAYLITWALWHWMPFDFTLRLPELAQKYRAGLVVLWPGTGEAKGFALTLGSSARNWLLALPVGTTAWLLTRRLRVRRVDAAVLVGFGLALAVSLAGLMTALGAIDLADISAAGLGTATGVWWAEWPLRPRGRAIGFAAVIALLLDQWAPFRFSTGAQAFSLVPFQSYVMAQPSQAVHEGLLKLQLGFALAFVGGFGPTRTRLAGLVWWVGICAGAEVGQMFVAGRYADVTDVLFLSSGVLAGLATRGIFQEEREAYEQAPADSRRRRTTAGGRQ